MQNIFAAVKSLFVFLIIQQPWATPNWTENAIHVNVSGLVFSECVGMRWHWALFKCLFEYLTCFELFECFGMFWILLDLVGMIRNGVEWCQENHFLGIALCADKNLRREATRVQRCFS